MSDHTVDRRRFLHALAALGATGCTHTLGLRTGPSAIVIGAGMAGITAARRLHDAGCRVTVLEARERIGGRIWSLRDASGTTLELGASWIHGHVGNPVAKLAASADVETIATDDDSYPAMYDHEGTAIATTRQKDFYAALKMLRANLRVRRDALAPARADESLATAIAAEIGAWQAKRALDDATVVGLRHLVATEIEGAYAESTGGLSLRHWSRGTWFEGKDLLVKSGYGSVVDRLAAGIDIRLGSEVVSIEYDARSVRVRLRSGAHLEAEHAVVTLPLGVLKANDVAFSPPLPPRKTAAIARLGFGVFDKLYLRFPERFWPEDISWLQHVGSVPSEWPMFFNAARYGNAPILVAFHTGDAARRLAAKSDAVVSAEALRVLELIGKQQRWRVQAPVAVHRTRWQQDRWAKGSYSHVSPGGHLSDFDELGASVGARLHFAGEATSSRHFMTVHAAYISGERVARSVLSNARPLSDPTAKERSTQLPESQSPKTPSRRTASV